MKLLVIREPSKGDASLGFLYINGVFECDTLEDVIREVEGRPIVEWKIAGDTAIPQGTYKVTFENSARFGPRTLTVNDVPGFDGIRIHAGNTDKDTHGCLLVGTRDVMRDVDFIGNSREALAKLKEKVSMAIKAGETVEIEYRNP